MQARSAEQLQTYASSLTSILCSRWNVRRTDFEDLDQQALLYLMETLKKVNNAATEKSFVYKSVLGLMLNYVKREIKRQQKERCVDGELDIATEECRVFDWDDLPDDHRAAINLIFVLSDDKPLTGSWSACQIKKAARKLLRSKYGWSHRRVRRVFDELKREYG